MYTVQQGYSTWDPRPPNFEMHTFSRKEDNISFLMISTPNIEQITITGVYDIDFEKAPVNRLLVWQVLLVGGKLS